MPCVLLSTQRKYISCLGYWTVLLLAHTWQRIANTWLVPLLFSLSQKQVILLFLFVSYFLVEHSELNSWSKRPNCSDKWNHNLYLKLYLISVIAPVVCFYLSYSVQLLLCWLWYSRCWVIKWCCLASLGQFWVSPQISNGHLHCMFAHLLMPGCVTALPVTLVGPTH